MANERGGLAAVTSSDNDTAEGLPDEDFIFEGEDGQLVGLGDDTPPSDEEIADGTETETPAELGEEGEGEVGEEETAGQQPGQPPAAKPAVAAPVTPPAPQPSQAPASEAAPPQRVPTFHEHVSANFPAAVDHVVAGGAFRLSKEELEVIDEAAAPVLERVSAKVYLQAITTMSRMLHEALPAAVTGLMRVQNDGAAHETAFFSDYGFDAGKHKGEITKIAQFVRFNNPNLAGKAYADEIARMGYSMLGVAPPARKPAGNGQQKAGVPGKPGAKVLERKAFAPAARSGGGPAQNRRAPGQPPQKVDPIADLSAMLGSSVDMDD